MSSDFNIDRFCRILAHQAPDAVIYADSRGVIRFWNAGAERIFEFSAAEATGKSLDIIIPENLRARHWAGFDQTMRTGKTRYGAGDILAVPALRKDRMRISIEFTVLPFHDETDHMLGIAAILRDVTKRFEEMKELRRQLAKSSRLAATSVIGAIGVSGGSASQDQAVATASLAPGGKPSAARPRFGLPTAPVVGEACCHGTPQKDDRARRSENPGSVGSSLRALPQVVRSDWNYGSRSWRDEGNDFVDRRDRRNCVDIR
jgi:PAS domain S-box-containing protein